MEENRKIIFSYELKKIIYKMILFIQKLERRNIEGVYGAGMVWHNKKRIHNGIISEGCNEPSQSICPARATKVPSWAGRQTFLCFSLEPRCPSCLIQARTGAPLSGLRGVSPSTNVVPGIRMPQYYNHGGGTMRGGRESVRNFFGSNHNSLQFSDGRGRGVASLE